MYTINDDLSIYVTRGDTLTFGVTAEDEGSLHHFEPGDILRIKVYGKKDAETVYLEKDFPVLENCERVEIYLTEEDTKFGEIISKPKDYWYEVELNPDTDPQTIIGYDEDGAKVFRLYPEGADTEADESVPMEEDIPFVDEALDLTSPRPVANQAITAAIEILKRNTEKEYVTPAVFGAVGDGVADDTAALQEALDTAVMVFVPDGTYRITSGLVLKEGSVLLGQSKSGTILKYDGDSGSLIDCSGKPHVGIENLTLLHDFETEQVGATNTAKAVNADSCSFSRFANLIIKGFDYGIYFSDNSWCSDVDNVTVQSCNYGVYSNGEFNNCSFIRYRATYCDYGAYIGAGRTSGFLDCQFEKNNTGLYKTNLGDMGVRTCYFEGNTQDIEVAWGQSTAYKVTIADSSFFKGGDQEDVGCIKLHGNAKTLLVVRNCSFTKNGDTAQHTVELYSGTAAKVILEDNYLQDGFTYLKSTLNDVNVANVVVRDAFDLRKASNSYKHSHTPTFVTPTDGVITLTGKDESVRFYAASNVEVLIPAENPHWNSYELMVIIDAGVSVKISKSADGDVVNNATAYTNSSGAKEYKMCKVVFLVARTSGNEYAIVWY